MNIDIEDAEDRGEFINIQMSKNNKCTVMAKDGDKLLFITANELQHILTKVAIYGNKHPDQDILPTLHHAGKWLGKAIAEGIHKPCVNPASLPSTLNALNIIIKKMENANDQ